MKQGIFFSLVGLWILGVSHPAQAQGFGMSAHCLNHFFEKVRSREALQNIDWREYYKSTGYFQPSNSPGQRVQYAPVFVSPTMNWAVPNSLLNGPPPPGAYGNPYGHPYGQPQPYGGKPFGD